MGGRQATAGGGGVASAPRRGGLLLPGLDGVAVLAGDDLDFRRGDELVRLHLERRAFDDERPYVVAQAVGVEVTLRARADRPGVWVRPARKGSEGAEEVKQRE